MGCPISPEKLKLQKIEDEIIKLEKKLDENTKN